MLSRLLRTTSLRLSLRYALLYSVLTALIFVAAFFFMRQELRDWIEDDLVAVAAEISSAYEAGGREGLLREIERRTAPNLENHMFYQISDADGGWLGGNVRRIDPAAASDTISTDAFEIVGTFNDEVTGFVIETMDFPDATVVLGKSSHLYHEAMESLASVLAVSLIPLLLAGLAFGTLVGRRTETRINAIRDTLTDISKGNLQRRVIDGDREDDIGRVVRSVNAALDRLQALVENQQQISTDIAHDLKTPVQRLRQKLERLHEGTDRPKDVETCIAETDTIIDTFHALLRIAQIDGGARRERFREVDLNIVCTTVADVFDAAAEEVGFTLNLQLSTGPVFVQGDPELLTQIVSNLVDNALRHCPTGTTVDLRTSSDGAALIVADDGPGIPAEERGRVFRRLYRLEKSRTTGGSGLGLSMVQAIADLHRATVTLSDNEPGLVVTVEFPRMRL